MPFKPRSTTAQDAETVARVRGACQGYLASHGPDAAVSVKHILDLLNPRGLWSLDPERLRQQPAPKPAQPEDDRDADPVTGCKPVTARPQA